MSDPVVLHIPFLEGVIPSSYYYGIRVYDSPEEAVAPGRPEGAVAFRTAEAAEAYCAWAKENFPNPWMRDGWNVKERSALLWTYLSDRGKPGAVRALLC